MKKRYLLLPVACALAAIGSARAQGLPCTTPVAVFPYAENFDTGPGGWTSGPNGGTAVSSWALGTPAKPVINSAFSGPNSWVTGLTASYSNDERSEVVSPCFNFSTLTAPAIAVYIWWSAESSWDGTVLQSSTDGGATWQNVGAVGDPDNWYNDPSLEGRPGGSNDGWSGRTTSTLPGSGGWVEARHELTGLAGQANVRLRFAFGADASAVDDGFAFDNVQIYQPAAADVGVAAITAPATGTNCSTSPQTVTVTIRNFGSAAQTNIPVSYSVNGGTAVTGTFAGPLAPGTSASYSFPTTYTPAGNGTYTFTASTDLTGDGNALNNAAPSAAVFTVITSLTGFPYSENFDAGAGGWTSGGASSSWALGTPAKPMINSAFSGANSWTTGLTGRYNNNENSYVISPCFDFTGLNLPSVELQVWWESDRNDGAALQSSIDGGATWQTIGALGDPDNWYTDSVITARPGGQRQGWTGNGSTFPRPLNGSGAWVLARHDMPGLANQSSVRLRIAFASNGFTTDDGFAFDNFRIYQPGPNDVGVVAITAPVNGTSCTTGPQTVTVTIRNFGSAAQTNIPVRYTVNGGTAVTGTFAGPLAPGATASFSFPTTFVPTGNATYTFTATTALGGDSNAANDAAPTPVALTLITSVTTFPYFQNFDNGPGGWAVTGTATWVLGTPAKPVINSAFSGANSWVTTLTGTYLGSDNSQVVSPCFDFSALTLPIAELKVWWSSEAGFDGTALQSSIDGGATWQNVGVVGDPDNWYNDASLDSRAGGSSEGWAGQSTISSGGWVTARHALSGLAGQSSVRLRLAFGSDGAVQADGFAFDNFQIYQPAANDVGVVAITAPASGTSCAAGPQPVTVTIRNFGSASQTNLPVSYTVNGGTPVTATFAGPLAPGADASFTFPTSFTPTGNATYTFSATTNLAGDSNALNNGIVNGVSLTVITPVSAFPYFANFDGGPAGWSSGTLTGGTAPSSWALGTPAKQVINSAFSGPNSWVTGLTADYSNTERSYVLSPCFDFSALTLPRVAVQIWWNAESSYDGTALQSSIDGGATWQNVGVVGDPDNWYNDNSLDSRAGGSSEGWSGRATSLLPGSGGWVRAQHDLTGLAGQSSVRLRFAFGSDGSAVDDGFAFDDFQVYQPAPNDVGVTAITAPATGTSCTLNAQAVTVTIRNFGSAAQTNIPVSYTVNGGTPVANTFAGPLAPGTAASFTFSTTFSAGAQGVYTFIAATALVGDANANNNAAPNAAVFTVVTPITAVPYTENFDNGPGGWSSGGTNSSWALGSPVKQVINGTASGANAWVTGLTTNYNNDENSYVISPCFDLSNVPLPGIELSVWWNSVAHSDGATLQYTTDGGATWGTIGTVGDPDNWYNDAGIGSSPGGQSEGWSGNGNPFPTPVLNGSGGYVTARHAVPGVGSRPSVRFRIAFASDGFTPDDGFAFDNFKIVALTPPPANDISVAALAQPVTGCSLTSAELVTVVVHNSGTAPQSSIPLTVRYTLPGGGSRTLSRTIAGPLAGGATQIVFFTQPQNFSAAGCYEFTVYTSLPNDQQRANDTLRVDVCNVNYVVTNTTPYLATFEGAGAGWSAVGGTWALGTPAKSTIQGAVSGTNAWVTGGLGTGRYTVFENSSVISPCFNLSALTNPTVELKVWFETEAQRDGASVQFTTDNGAIWTTLGGVGDTAATDWYNSAAITAQPGTNSNGWTGSSGRYLSARHTLLGTAAARQSQVRFRVAFAATQAVPPTNADIDDGIAFDDFAIYSRPTLDAAVVGLEPLGSACGFTTTEQIRFRVRNQGRTALTTLPISYQINGGATVSTVATVALAPGEEAVVTFPQTANLTVTPCVDVTVAVALAGDQLNFNNSLTTRVCNLAANTIPTAISFSTATDLGRLQMQTATRSRIALSPGGGSSGGALLMTGGGGAWIDPIGPGNSPWVINATHRATATLCVKTTTLPVGSPLRLSFNLKQLSTGAAGLFANVNFRVLVNGTVIGQPNYQPSPLSPGSGAYQPLSFNITNFRNGSNNILVELQSSVNRDYTNGQGDVNLIDDLAVEVGIVSGLGAESAFAQGVGVFPNPSTGVFHVSLDHAGTRTYALRVTDLTGRVVRTQQVRAAGHADAALDLSALARGTYVLHVTDSEGNRVVRKLTLE